MKRVKIEKLSATLVTIALAGCATVPTPQAQSVVEVGAGMIQGCHLLGTVHGQSQLEGIFEAKGVENAKTHAMADAARWGANAIVWTNIRQRYWGAELVTGNAYRCPRAGVAQTNP